MKKERVDRQIETLFTLAKERGLVPMWTHYYRDNGYDKELAATSCILLDPGGYIPLTKGLAVVSYEDNGEKAFGRLLSIKRAFAAFVTRTENRDVLMTDDIFGFKLPLSYKSKWLTDSKVSSIDWNPDLTDIEVDRIQAKRERLRGTWKTSEVSDG